MLLHLAGREPEDRLFVEQGVDDARRSEALVELGGDVVDTPLRPDILARDDDFLVREHQVGERPAEEPRHMLRLVQRAGIAAEHRLARSEEHTSELQSLMRISYAVFCLK